MMVWGVALIFVSYAQVLVMSHEIEVQCREFSGLPPASHISPSLVVDLNVHQVTVEGKQMLNISWAISCDASVKYLTGTRISVSGEPSYRCEYNPPLANVTGSGVKWFHYLVKARPGPSLILVANLPLPPRGSGPSYKFKSMTVNRPVQPIQPIQPTQHVTQNPTQVPTDFPPVETTISPSRTERVTITIFGALAGLMILSSCYIMCKYNLKHTFSDKNCGAIATSLGFKSIPQSPVPILVVYPAENSTFQRAVVALAEFLQWHGGCNVAIDMWQQGKIAELGPMRWLAEQAKAADRVLIICPQPGHSPANHSLPEPSIPAAAHDLYPLILNMVASHSKSASELAKFLVVQLSKAKIKRPSNLPPELRACKTFCLMKDLNKLCSSLHTHAQGDNKISDLIFRPGISYSEKSTVKLREAVEKHFQRGGTTENCVYVSF